MEGGERQGGCLVLNTMGQLFGDSGKSRLGDRLAAGESML